MNFNSHIFGKTTFNTTENEKLIRHLKKETQKPVIGYLCCFAPPEIIAAAGAIPYRISGHPGSDTSKADAYVEPYGCTYVRSILARAAEGQLDFLDGLVISHSCDMVQRLYGIWTYYHPLNFSYLFNVPHQLTPWAKDFFKRELGFFREKLEQFTGQQVTTGALNETIGLYNKNRSLVRQIYELRKAAPPPVEGSEAFEILMAGGVLPADQYRTFLESALKNFQQRKPDPHQGPRIMIWGSIMDSPILFEVIEKAGGKVVCDDTCIGFRTWEKDVPQTADPYDGLTEHYFVNFQCPRTDRGPSVKRFNYLLERARAYRVDGVVGYIISFCDPHKFDYPDLRDYLKKEGLPLLLIDDNYSFEPLEALKTRLEAFMEMRK